MKRNKSYYEKIKGEFPKRIAPKDTSPDRFIRDIETFKPKLNKKSEELTKGRDGNVVNLYEEAYDRADRLEDKVIAALEEEMEPCNH